MASSQKFLRPDGNSPLKGYFVEIQYRMELALKYRGKSMEYSGIGLKEFYIPTVDDMELDFSLESAIWFKCLAIKSMVIDCDVHNVFWEPKYPSGAEPPRAVFEDNRLEENELFNSAMNIVKLKDKKSCKTEIAKEVSRILHLFVFPIVVLRRADLSCLEDILRQVEEKIFQINIATVERDKQLAETEHKLKEERNDMVLSQKMEFKKYLKHCNGKFLEEFLEDISRDIRMFTNKLVAFQSNSTDGLKSDIKTLERKRQKDEIQSRILKLQSIQEAIKHSLTKRKKKKSKPKIYEEEEHNQYLGLKAKIMQDKTEMHDLFQGKVKVTSVREAIIQACKDLRTIGESTGVDVMPFGEFSSTDILGTTSKPKKWLTLNERIQCLLNDNSNNVSKIYSSFHSDMSKKIIGFLAERALFDKKKEENLPFFFMSEYTLPPRKENSGSKKEDKNRYANVSSDIESDSPYRRFTQLIKGEIMQHTYDQCQQLVNILSKQKANDKKAHCSKVSLNNTWVFYEFQLYGYLIEHLCELYEYIHKAKAKDMLEYIKGKSLTDLGVQEPWLIGSSTTEQAQARQSCNKCFERNVSVVAQRNGRNSCNLIDICESDDELLDLFDIPPNEPNNKQKSTKTNNETQARQSKDKQECLGIITSEVKNMIRSKSIIGKLRSVARINKMVSDWAMALKAEHCGCGDEAALNADDMLASTTYMLTKFESPVFEKLYSHIHLTNDFIPPFMMGSVQDWALTTFYCSFQTISCNMEGSSESESLV